MASGIYYGAIRWDFWYSNTGACRSTGRNVGNPTYRSRAPFFTRELSSNYVSFEGLQADMDKEIAFAKASGLSYWAFLLYDRAGNDAEGMQGYDLYQSSVNKNDIKFCQMRPTSLLGSTGNFAVQVAEAVAMCTQSNYQKVLTNRPLIYLYWDGATNFGGSLVNMKVAIDAIRTGCTNAGLGTPYIVLVDSVNATNVSNATALGIEAIASYVEGATNTVGQSYASMASLTASAWTTKAALYNMVPTCMAGWNRAPRIVRPVSWQASSQEPFKGLDTVVPLPTTNEEIAHYVAAKTFVEANPTKCDSKAVLIYAWNEFDEGGYLCPTLGDPTGQRLLALTSTFTF